MNSQQIPESAPSFSIKKDSPIKMPAYLLVSIISVAVAATILWTNLAREVWALQRDLIEAQRVNQAQDKRFENLEAGQADFAVIKNNVRWLERQEAARGPREP